MIIIYHSKDLDGYCSGAICKRKYPDATLIGYDYGQEFPWEQIPIGEPVIMVDVSLDMIDMHRLYEHSDYQFTWIDHHISAKNDYWAYIGSANIGSPLWRYIYESGKAACEIAWEYLFPFKEGHEIPAAVKLLGMYDTWRQSDTFNWEKEILPFQYGMRLRTNSADTFPMHLFNIGLGLSDTVCMIEGLELIIDRGNTILEYQRQQDKLAMSGAFEAEFKGYRAICCNVRGVGSLAFDSVYDPDKYDLMLGFGFNGRGLWTFSLRTTHDPVDCSELAKLYGGGGHKKAAGFSSKSLENVILLP